MTTTDNHTPSNPRYLNVHVQLTGTDGNAYSIMGKVATALRRAGVSQENVDAYMAEATSADYDHLLHVTACTVEVS